MTYDLTRFDLGAMLKCSLKLREAAAGASTLEGSAQRVCRFFYDELRTPGGERACALVRCYKTHAYGSLAPDLQEFARTVLGDTEPRHTMKCLTLMATIGQSAAWNSRFLSQGHRAIPLPSPDIVEKAPMISQLIKELGLELSAVLQPSPEVVKELAGKRHGVFHVENALGSPYIPAQQEFVVRYGVASVVGIGGMLPTGDFFAVILFSTVPVPAHVADRFRSLVLDVKAAFTKFTDANVFEMSVPQPWRQFGRSRANAFSAYAFCFSAAQNDITRVDDRRGFSRPFGRGYVGERKRIQIGRDGAGNGSAYRMWEERHRQRS